MLTKKCGTIAVNPLYKSVRTSEKAFRETSFAKRICRDEKDRNKGE